jgi:hypothetical protein
MKVFAIAGTFFQTSEQLDIRHQSENEGGTVAIITQESMSHVFSGYFQVPSLGNCYGQLVDAYGLAVIEGATSDTQLSFEKVYQRTGNTVWYNYTKTDTGLWVGTYEGDHVAAGITHCIITELDETLFSLNP